MEGDSARFAEGLEQGDLDALMQVPKAERHMHMEMSGNPKFIFKRTGVWIPPIQHTLHHRDDMHQWTTQHIDRHLQGIDGKNRLIEACFEQATRDTVCTMWAGEDVSNCDAVFDGDVAALVDTVYRAQERYAPATTLHLQMGFSRWFDVDSLLRWSEPFFDQECFDCVDLYGDQGGHPIETFVPLYRIAKKKGMALRAHVGEQGTADDVMRAVEALELDEVQHGITAARSGLVMRFLADHRIRLNVCPTSDLRLGRVETLSDHPVRVLVDAGVRITINTNELLMSGSMLSQEFLRLYQCGLFTAKELDGIRLEAF